MYVMVLFLSSEIEDFIGVLLCWGRSKVTALLHFTYAINVSLKQKKSGY